MKLFKNVDVSDIKSIMEQGILPISVTNNNNWASGRRANNSTDLVYLFSPTSELNTFVQYGLILLEVETDNAWENEFVEGDVNKDLYTEFVAKEIKPSEITAIYAPAILREKIEPFVTGLNVTYVEIVANVYNYKTVKRFNTESGGMMLFADGPSTKDQVTEEQLQRFAETVGSLLTEDYNYFTGTREDGARQELYDIQYLI